MPEAADELKGLGLTRLREYIQTAASKVAEQVVDIDREDLQERLIRQGNQDHMSIITRTRMCFFQAISEVFKRDPDS